MCEEQNKAVVFQERQICPVLHNEAGWLIGSAVIEILTRS